MFKKLARWRMEAIDDKIRELVDIQDVLTRSQEERLLRLDRAHKFWRRIAD